MSLANAQSLSFNSMLHRLDHINPGSARWKNVCCILALPKFLHAHYDVLKAAFVHACITDMVHCRHVQTVGRLLWHGYQCNLLSPVCMICRSFRNSTWWSRVPRQQQTNRRLPTAYSFHRRIILSAGAYNQKPRAWFKVGIEMLLMIAHWCLICIRNVLYMFNASTLACQAFYTWSTDSSESCNGDVSILCACYRKSGLF